ncbi:MAG TPA: hypothetical protein VG457_03920, partial [Planctomycetota bacterium]|nr:hypothetical protein [Planctomycetota bacterium]
AEEDSMPRQRKAKTSFYSKDGPTPAEIKWRPVLEEWRRSGLDAADFCRDRRLAVSALQHWKKEIQARDQRRSAQRAAEEASRQSMRLLSVRVVESQPAASPGALEVVLRGGRLVRLLGDFDPAILRKLLLALEDAR